MELVLLLEARIGIVGQCILCGLQFIGTDLLWRLAVWNTYGDYIAITGLSLVAFISLVLRV